MGKSFWVRSALAVACLSVLPGRAAAPPSNPRPGLVHSPFSAEVEVYGGGISGKSVGAAFDSVSKATVGARLTFGVLRLLNLSVGYLYSNQTRSFSTTLPPLLPTLVPPTLPQTGTAVLQAKNLQMVYANTEFNLLHLPRATFYLSPGVGLARNGARNVTVITPFGSSSYPAGSGAAVSVNLGAGVKIFPLKHFGVRIDARDFVSQGGTGSLNPPGPLPAFACPVAGPGCNFLNPAQYFGTLPVQNNIVLTLGLIFKLL